MMDYLLSDVHEQRQCWDAGGELKSIRAPALASAARPLQQGWR
jgi:hypothetical protein